MTDVSTPQQFLSRLREFRPELTEFLLACERGNANETTRTATHNRLRYIVQEGFVHGYCALSNAAEIFLSSTEHEPAALARLMEPVLNAALHALTFSAPPPLIVPEILAPGLTKKPVLVAADDDRVVCEMMQRLFGRITELHLASDGEEALKLVEAHHPDLVILDDFMPRMTGLKLIETLHETRKFSAIPVIMLTGSDRERDRNRAIQAGAVDYIMKPFDPVALLHKVQQKLALCIRK